MNRQTTHRGKRLAWVPLLMLSFSISVAAATPAASPKPGGYCPAPDILLVTAEELSASLDLAMGSRAALLHKDQVTASSELTSVGTTLHLAASRGEAARTILLIDAIIQAKTADDYAQMLAWFPLLQTSLLTLPDDATVSAASDWVGDAEDILRGEKEGDPETSLKEARHMLACDGLDIPLQQAIAAQGKLMKQLSKNTKNSGYDSLLNSLRSALAYTLGNSEM